MTSFAAPVVAWHGDADAAAALVVLLHGRGSNETDIISLAEHLPAGAAYAAVRAPIGEGGGYAWFANRGIGRPTTESLAETMAWFGGWLDQVAPDGRPVVPVGFSGGGAFAGGLVLDDPGRYASAGILYATLPFDAVVPITPVRARHLGSDRLSWGIFPRPVVCRSSRSPRLAVSETELPSRTWTMTAGPGCPTARPCEGHSSGRHAAAQGRCTMRVTIVGAGNMGRGVGSRMVAAGNEVELTTSKPRRPWRRLSRRVG